MNFSPVENSFSVSSSSASSPKNSGRSSKTTSHLNHSHIQAHIQRHDASFTNSNSLSNRVLSLSATSITSLLPNFYSIGGNYSMPTLNNSSSSLNNNGTSGSDPSSFISDELARESDVTVSTNVTPQAEYKGFASYVISCIFLFTWLSWSVLPDRLLNRLGIYYYPSRWWALAIPAYVLVVMMYSYVAIGLYNIEVLTLPLEDNRNLVDDSGIIITELKQYNEADLDDYLFKSTSGIWDLPISKINEVLYTNLEEDHVLP